jgi:hypothetical protein
MLVRLNLPPSLVGHPRQKAKVTMVLRYFNQLLSESFPIGGRLKHVKSRYADQYVRCINRLRLVGTLI